jgi:hypothetical protein
MVGRAALAPEHNSRGAAKRALDKVHRVPHAPRRLIGALAAAARCRFSRQRRVTGDESRERRPATPCTRTGGQNKQAGRREGRQALPTSRFPTPPPLPSAPALALRQETRTRVRDSKKGLGIRPRILLPICGLIGPTNR